MGIDAGGIWLQGFRIIPQMTASGLGQGKQEETIEKSKTASLLAQILVANSPQVLISFL